MKGVMIAVQLNKVFPNTGAIIRGMTNSTIKVFAPNASNKAK